MTLREYEHFLCLAVPAVKIFIRLPLSDEYKERNDDDLWQPFEPSKYRREQCDPRLGHCPLISQDEKEQRKNVFLVRCIEVWNFPSRQAMGIPLFEPFSTMLDKGGETMLRGAIKVTGQEKVT